ncbi:MAG: hypothetical protein HGGPFJEG_01337 [Ignavibacteria bacterium]|nr:hypothetical protein [Ignavibacteria bacterium]
MKKIFIAILSIWILTGVENKVQSEPRNVLIEYCTGTWCGWCPCGHQALTSIKAAFPRTVVISYHGGATSSDPWKDFNGVEIRSMLGFTGYPTGIFDRTNTPSNPYVTYDMWMGRTTDRYTNFPNASVRLQITSKSFNSSNNTLDLSVNATALEELQGQYKLSFVLVEDNLVYQQNHYSQCGTTGYVPDYVHKHVVRSMLNGATGENLNTGGVWNLNQTIGKNLNTTLNAAWAANNCKIVIFVYKDSSTVAHGNVQQAIEESVIGTTGINANNEIPSEYSLSQNFPNPFNPVTNIKFTIPEDGLVSFKIYDIMGREVENYINDILPRGSYNVQVDGSKLSSGVYYYELRAEKFRDTKRMVLVK